MAAGLLMIVMVFLFVFQEYYCYDVRVLRQLSMVVDGMVDYGADVAIVCRDLKK